MNASATESHTPSDQKTTVYNEPAPVKLVLGPYLDALDKLIAEAEATKAQFMKDLKKMDLAQALRGDRAEELKKSGFVLRFAQHIKEQILQEQPCTSDAGYQFMDNRIGMLQNNMKNTASNMACRDLDIRTDATDLYRAYQKIACHLTTVHVDMFDEIYADI